LEAGKQESYEAGRLVGEDAWKRGGRKKKAERQQGVYY